MGSMGKRQGDTKVIIPSKNEIKYCIIFLPPGAAVPAVLLEFAAAVQYIPLWRRRQGKSGPVHGQGSPLRFLPPVYQGPAEITVIQSQRGGLPRLRFPEAHAIMSPENKSAG